MWQAILAVTQVDRTLPRLALRTVILSLVKYLVKPALGSQILIPFSS